jgi:Ca2+-binding RTX toxin-like protein
MTADNVNYFVGNFASGNNTAPDVTGLTIRNCEVNGFTKAAVLLQYNTNNVTIDHVVGDSKYQTTDIFAMGIHMYGTVHNVTVQNCAMLNCMKPGTSSSYWNGDGYTTESGTYSIHFINCMASGNGDAGFDIKSKNTVLDNCTSEDNGRNYRLWADATLNNCAGTDPHVRGGTASQAQVWVGNGAHVTVSGGHFDDSGSKTIVGITSGGYLTFKSTEITHASGAKLTSGSGISGIDQTLVHSVTVTGNYSTNGDTLLGHTAASAATPESTSVTGTAGADVLTVATASTIKGLAGNDTITGSPGNDHIIGGAATDILRGNAGADLFQFASASESNVGAPDRILDFQPGVDHIDLANIDAIGSTLANDSFKYIGASAFSHHAGELRLDYSQTGFTIVQGDTNGDGTTDFAIKLTGHLALTSGDFIL